MTIYLRQSTASQEVPLGHFVDSTDGNTEETGLTVAAASILIWKTGATTLAAKNSGDATHISNGIYYAVLDATDTNTLGPLVIFVHVTGALPVRLECVVLDEPVYDLLITAGTPATNLLDFFDGTGYAGGTAKLDVNVTAMANGTITAAAIATGAIDADAIAADAVTEIQSGLALAADLSTDAEIADAVWDEVINTGHAVANSAAVDLVSVLADTNELQVDDYPTSIAAVKSDTAAILVDTGTTLDGRIPAALVGGRMDANVGAISTDATAADNAEAFFDGTGYAGTNNVIPLVTTTTTATNVTTVNGLAANVITATAIAADAIGASELAADALAEIADAVLDEVFEGTTTFRQALRIVYAALAGKAAGGGTTTVTFRDIADSKNRISATVDANGNRTAITLDAA
jgi:hypothetical protein